MEEEQKEQKQQTAANTLCEECREKASKYKCPGCSVRTCGLACVKAHKQRTSCSGKPNRTQFVPISQFDDNRLLSDYNLLEQIKTVADSARRTRNQLRAYPNLRLPYHLQHLKKAAAKRSTKLLLLPSGMSKREKNQSRFNLR
ncbi:hypothetical protein Tsubulata_040801 [Turnera subulata]|nr:hypothetical protein Tsubulata_040801 [Turnera subulata]